MRQPFEEIFHTSNSAKDKFLSRLFGLFSEDVVRQWCRCPDASYENLGRPTIKIPGEQRGYTLDFTLRDRTTGDLYVTEMKCELEFENYRYLRLNGPDQVRHHHVPAGASSAFKRFVEFAKDQNAFDVRVSGKPLSVNGAILIWGGDKS